MALVIDKGEDRVIKVEFEGSEVEFTVGPDRYENIAAAFKFVAENELFTQDMGGRIMYQYKMLRRIKEWKGVTLPDGSEAPCNEQTKMIFFGKFPGILNQVISRMAEAEETDQKNL